MPTYSYHCPACGEDFDRILPISRYDEPQSCSSCGEVAKKVPTAVHFNLPGDGWASKNGRLEKQMAAKNSRLTAKQNERMRDAPMVTLAPNVDGERVGSWSEAQKLAKAKGKDTSSYEPLVRKEAAAKK
jgi:putative FmdB family regulatory protein